MLYGHNTELAIRATLFLSIQPPGKLSPAHEIARATGLSEPYLAKILRRLTSAGLVRAYRGPGRGMELARPAADISLAAVVCAIEGRLATDWCGLGLQSCNESNPCPLHQDWVGIRANVERLLEQTTLASLAHRLRFTEGPGAPAWLHFEKNQNTRGPEFGTHAE